MFEVDPQSCQDPRDHADETDDLGREHPPPPRAFQPDAPVDLAALLAAGAVLPLRRERREADGTQGEAFQDDVSRPIGEDVDDEIENRTEDDLPYDFPQRHNDRSFRSSGFTIPSHSLNLGDWLRNFAGLS
jgi:hypothetical protein